MRRAVDLNTSINDTVIQGNVADFPVSLVPMLYESSEGHRPMPARKAVVRNDTGQAIAVVSNRYKLVPHSRIIDVVEQALSPLDIGPVPRGIYVDRDGARMRALWKVPSLAQPVLGGDEICPCLQVRNTYDGTTRVTMHIGAFRLVCTNLAVGGGGIFAGGFMSVHAGDIPIEKMGEQLAQYLTRFDRIVALYRHWSEQRLQIEALSGMFQQHLKKAPQDLWWEVQNASPQTVFDAYNAATDYATHRMRTARAAFNLLERVNTGFQKTFPVIKAEAVVSGDDGTLAAMAS